MKKAATGWPFSESAFYRVLKAAGMNRRRERGKAPVTRTDS